MLIVDGNINPGNNFAEIPRNLFQESAEIPRNLLQKNPVKMSTAIPKEFPITYSQEFHVTHSKEFLRTLSEEFLLTNSREFLWENVDQIRGNLCEFPEKSSLEPIPGNFLGTIPKIFPGVSRKYLEIFSAYSWVNSLIRT